LTSCAKPWKACQAKIWTEDLTHTKQQCYHLACNVKNQFHLFIPHITCVLLKSRSSHKRTHNTSKTEPSLRNTNHHRTHVHMTHSKCIVPYISHTFHYQNHIHTHTTLMLNLQSLLKTFLSTSVHMGSEKRQWNLDFTFLESTFSLILDMVLSVLPKPPQNNFKFSCFQQVPWLYLETGHKLTWRSHLLQCETKFFM
jgi:hypothetical protein